MRVARRFLLAWSFVVAGLFNIPLLSFVSLCLYFIAASEWSLNPSLFILFTEIRIECSISFSSKSHHNRVYYPILCNFSGQQTTKFGTVLYVKVLLRHELTKHNTLHNLPDK